MTAAKNKQTGSGLNTDVWIISPAQNSQFDQSQAAGDQSMGLIRKYLISDIARYLLNPNPIEVEKRLIGCEIHYPRRTTAKIIGCLKHILPRRLRRGGGNHAIPPEVLISRCRIRIPSMKDKAFESHLNKLYESLRSYDAVSRRLPQLDPSKIAHIIGICEDIGGNLSYLKLQGNNEDKLKYVHRCISKHVGVLLRKAYIAEGLYEMRGFDFNAYRSGRTHRLITYQENGKPRCCVLDSDNKVEYVLDDIRPIKYMLLLEQTLQADENLKKAFERCIENQARPFKLFFNRQLEVDYSRCPLPGIYRNILRTVKIEHHQRNLIRSALNYMQIGISFNYAPQPDGSANEMVTRISVLHDLRALDVLRKNLPRVYDEISKCVSASEAGRFYLLDSIEGYNHDGQVQS